MAFVQDLRQGARLLLRSPGFTIVAVMALAIGIGANTAIFSVVNTLLIERLPYHDADRLAVIWEHNLPRDRKNNVVSPGNFLHWRDMQQSFTDIAAVGGMSGFTFKITVSSNGEPEEVPYQMVSPSFFSILGVQPALGRAFSAAEEAPQTRVAIISDALWRRRFSADPSLLGKPITLAEEPYTVVGIMPPGFSYLDKNTDVWVPLGFPAAARTPRGRWINVMGRLKPGVTFEQAQQDMARVHAELTTQFPDFNTGWTARVVPLREQLTGEIGPALLFMLGAVAFVLLIACANVANLLLARATARRRELAVRAALGAGRGRIVRQLLAESLVLAAVGGVAGLLLAYWGLHVLRSTIADHLPIQRLDGVAIDGWVLGFTAAAALTSGLIFGLIPAFSASGAALTAALKEGGRSGSAASGNRARNAFVVVEVALALVLLVGAGLLVRSFLRVLDVDPGFDPSRTMTMSVSLPSARYATPAVREAFFSRVFEHLDALPGVEATGAVSFLPMTGLGAATGLEIVASRRCRAARGRSVTCGSSRTTTSGRWASGSSAGGCFGTATRAS
jgi:putative ABC transport system permease protein